MSSTIKISEGNFEQEVLKSEKPVLVDVSTEWCGPCKMLAPVIDELAREYDGKVKITKLDADESPDIAARYSILSVPTLLFFKNGEIVDTQTGLIPKQELKSKIDSLI